MNFDTDGKWALLMAAAVLVVFTGMALFDRGFEAEAVIGGVGNVTDATNPHNLSVTGPGPVKASTEKQICIFCHTPHRAIMSGGTDAPLLNAPLWNHELSPASTVYNVTAAINASGYQLVDPPSQPDGASKLCLSCHDGTVAVGAVSSRGTDISMLGACLDGSGKMTSTCGASFMDPDTALLEGSHHLTSIPVNDALIANRIAACIACDTTQGVKYPWSAPDAQPTSILLRPTTATYDGKPGVSGTDALMDGAPLGKYRDGYNYGVQCTSCHDPHFYTVILSNSNAFLVMESPDTFNYLCLACHDDCSALCP